MISCKKNKCQIKIGVIFLNYVFICGLFTGCIENNQLSDNEDIILSEMKLDKPSILPDWKDGEYHD